MGYMIGVDVGGTFTDFSLFDKETGQLAHYKRSSTPEDPSKAIMDGIMSILEDKGIMASDVEYLAHGTTVATNALIEKKGAKMALVTTEGFKDLMEIGWQKRPSLYDLLKKKPEDLIAPGMKLEVSERICHDGSEIEPLDEDAVRQCAKKMRHGRIQSAAVCTLFSFLNPSHEQRIAEILTEEYPELYLTASHCLVPEFREYPRMSTTVLNAYLGPVMKSYVENFEDAVRRAGIMARPYVTQSNGSIISVSETVDCPIKTAVSGPSAGVIGAICVGRQCGEEQIITFDMGGTSIDVSLIENGKAKLSGERLVEGYPARIPMLDIVTLGAGGGSIARIDAGGAMKVGPQSAGATPGPACYKRGGTLPCVTDANIVLGKLNHEKILGGCMEVDYELAVQAIEKNICEPSGLSLKAAASGIISVVNANMMQAIRLVSVERGYDVREFTLMAFGGAGPLHACEVAAEMGIRKVLFPPSPGTLCSLGLLMADTRFDLSRSRILLAKAKNVDDAADIFKELLSEGNRLLSKEGISQENRMFTAEVECRYNRQNYELPISVRLPFTEDAMNEMTEKFHMEHERSYGYLNRSMDIQMVGYRLSAVGLVEKPELEREEEAKHPELPAPAMIRPVLFEGSMDYTDTPVYHREQLVPGIIFNGPAILEQMDSTSVIPPGWTARVDGFRNILAVQEGGRHEK